MATRQRGRLIPLNYFELLLRKQHLYQNTVELQWLEHLWDHRKLFETWGVRATEG